MNIKILILSLFALYAISCNHNHADEHNHDTEHEEHEEIKFIYTAYTNDYELFAEADAFIVGETSNILSHFSNLPEFNAVEHGSISVTLSVNGNEITQTLEKPTRKGIYSFDIKAQTAGKGSLSFKTQKSIIIVPNVFVFSNHKEAHEEAEKNEISKTNTFAFTKEQSWKIDFATELPKTEPFGELIKTVAKIESAAGDQNIISAKASGIVLFSDNNILEGKNVVKGQKLFAVSSGGMSEDNIAVKISEAKSNYENAIADYERHKELAVDKIISEKELMSAKNLYENTKTVYENLTKNFSYAGQQINSTMTGFVKQILVKNGEYVEAGQPLIIVAQNKNLILNAYVQQKYINSLAFIVSANIRTMHDNRVYTFNELNGKVLSFGKAANTENFLIPVNLQIDNVGSFVQGSFVEVFLKTVSNTKALTVPNSALIEEQGNFFVFVQLNPELFEKRLIQIGPTDGLFTEVISGINSTDRIITKGAVLVKLAQAAGALDAHSGHVH